MSDEVLESVKEAVERVRGSGMEGDVYAVKGRYVTFSIKKGEISDSSEYVDVGLGIRVIKDDKIGFGYCVPGEEGEGVAKAAELSKFSGEIGISLPSDEDMPNPEINDKMLRQTVKNSEGAELTQKMIDGASGAADDVIPTRGDLTLSLATRIVGNTEGLLVKERGTHVSGSVTASIDLGMNSLQAEEIRVSRRLDIDFEGLGSRAGEKVDSMRDSSKILNGNYPVVVSPNALAQLLGFGMLPAINGEKVRKGKSVYRDKLGEKVTTGTLSMRDDPTLDWSIGGGAFDDEGVTSGSTSIISHGVLDNFIYNLKDGAKSDAETTANGVRDSFRSPPDTKHRNVVLRGEGNCVCELMPDKGVYVDNVLGAHTTNPVNGDFSVVANPAWLVDGGEKKGRIDGLMISGNLPEVLKSVWLADNYKKCYKKIGSQGIIIEAPTARLNNVTLSGK